MEAAADTDQLIMIGVLMISSLLNVAYLIPIVAKGFFLTDENNNAVEGIKEAPFWCVAPPVFTALGCIALFFYAGELQAFLMPIVEVK